jgi:hypothetical protein
VEVVLLLNRPAKSNVEKFGGKFVLICFKAPAFFINFTLHKCFREILCKIILYGAESSHECSSESRETFSSKHRNSEIKNQRLTKKYDSEYGKE